MGHSIDSWFNDLRKHRHYSFLQILTIKGQAHWEHQWRFRHPYNITPFFILSVSGMHTNYLSFLLYLDVRMYVYIGEKSNADVPLHILQFS